MADTQISDHVQAAFNAVGNIEGALLPVLHEIQALCGYIPSDAVPLVADRLNLTRAEVHGVISYYHHFRQHPPARSWSRSAARKPVSRWVRISWPSTWSNH